MNKTVVIFFLLCIGLILLIIWMQTSQSKNGDFSSGLFLLYCGIVSLFYTRKKEKNSMGGLWFRGLVTGILCVLAGLYLILNFFFPQ